MFLAKTIEDIIEHSEAKTEIIAVLDGQWADPAIPQHPMVNIIYVPEAIGQRAGQNLACRLAKGKYVMKVDAHCSFDQGFDRKMIEFMEQHPEDTAVPIMRNLWSYDWACYHNYCGWSKYQGPTPKVCPKCGKSDKLRRKMMWVGKNNPQSVSYCFDPEPHFQYFEEYKHREPFITDKKEKGYTETMSLQGSCFMCSRENYWKYEMCDEKAGSWGNQGIELALSTWLCGRKVLVNHNTWYAHMFRTQGGDFSFPYPQGGRSVQKTKDYIKDKFWNMKHPLQIHPVSWLVERFSPVMENATDKNGKKIGWTEEKIKQLKEHEGSLKK
jgi:hypothetical protein